MIEYKDNKPTITDTKAKSYSLFDWQSYFRHVFYENNTRIKKEGYQDNQVAFLRGYILSHISQDLGDVAEAIRESDQEKINKKIGSLFAWIFALANELDENIEDMIREKYPGFCPYCRRREDCICPWWVSSQTAKGKDEDVSKLIPIEGTAQTKPGQLTGWIEQWEIIYGRKYKIAMSKADIMYKLLEEEAEILEELDGVKGKKLNKGQDYFKKIQKEFADFLSWFFAVVYKLETERYLDRKDLPIILHKKFERGCPWCTKAKCVCQPKWLDEESS